MHREGCTGKDAHARKGTTSKGTTSKGTLVSGPKVTFYQMAVPVSVIMGSNATLKLNLSFFQINFRNYEGHLCFAYIIHFIQLIMKIKKFKSLYTGKHGKYMKNSVFWDVTPCGSCENRRK
jgi:hypothetical protein